LSSEGFTSILFVNQDIRLIKKHISGQMGRQAANKRIECRSERKAT